MQQRGNKSSKNIRDLLCSEPKPRDKGNPICPLYWHSVRVEWIRRTQGQSGESKQSWIIVIRGGRGEENGSFYLIGALQFPALPFLFIIWIDIMGRIDPKPLFTPMLSDYCAELHWVAIPSQRAMSQLLFLPPPPSPEITALSCWCSWVQYGRPLKHSFFLHLRSFLCSYPLFFLPSLSPFSISIKRHPSAEYGSAFSGYPDGTVSALWTGEHWLLQLPAVEERRSAAAHICLHQDVAFAFFFFFYLSAALNIQQTKPVPRGFPLGRLH